jgi:hypothetical protein
MFDRQQKNDTPACFSFQALCDDRLQEPALSRASGASQLHRDAGHYQQTGFALLKTKFGASADYQLETRLSLCLSRSERLSAPAHTKAAESARSAQCPVVGVQSVFMPFQRLPHFVQVLFRNFEVPSLALQ